MLWFLSKNNNKIEKKLIKKLRYFYTKIDRLINNLI